MSNESVFIFTEIYNCGKIGKICLESFQKYHPNININVFGTPKDYEWIKNKSNIIFHDITNLKNIIDGFNQGHLGTATLWAKIIKERNEKYIVHIDSDVIFMAECMTDLYNGISENYDLIGPIRNYKHNPNYRDDVRHLPDLTQTLFFAFNREKVSDWDMNTLICMCRGTCNPLGNSTIDFFDPVMFDILKHNGKIKHLSDKDYGGCNYFGKRDTNDFPEQNQLIDFGKKLAHFSAVGSGMNFYNNYAKITAEAGYVQYAIEKYAIYCKIFYNESISVPVNLNKYNCLLNIKEWF